ncbi:UNVERIFIED_CONTAM: hypothetical protein HDU68_007433, partial [Siphonaria sp. JEL0065]
MPYYCHQCQSSFDPPASSIPTDPTTCSQCGSDFIEVLPEDSLDAFEANDNSDGEIDGFIGGGSVGNPFQFGFLQQMILTSQQQQQQTAATRLQQEQQTESSSSTSGGVGRTSSLGGLPRRSATTPARSSTFTAGFSMSSENGGRPVFFSSSGSSGDTSVRRTASPNRTSGAGFIGSFPGFDDDEDEAFLPGFGGGVRRARIENIPRPAGIDPRDRSESPVDSIGRGGVARENTQEFIMEQERRRQEIMNLLGMLMQG